ncbi:MAG: DUF3048 domain-containing protein [Actinomycetota bacterium]
MSRRRTYLAIGLAALAVLLAGALAFGACSDGDDGDAEVTAETTTTTRRRVTTTTGPLTLAPLTGLNDPTGTSAARGALAVKIDNVALAKRPPQAGIDVADVVYEEPVEGSATRFLAIFHSTLPERIGPVRSTRFLDPGIVWHLGGLYVYSGGTPPKVQAIRDSPVQTVDENGLQNSGARERDPNFEAPHNLFLHPDELWAWDQVGDRVPPTPLFDFLGEGAEFAGQPASVVDIPTKSNAKYTWDAANGAWNREAVIRSGPAEPHVAESGDRIAPTNVIVQSIGAIRDNADDKNLLVGEGDAWVCSQGLCTQGKWQRASLETRTDFVDATGAPILLTPGTTWVHFITTGAPTVTP